jgi:hypothetical protein
MLVSDPLIALNLDVEPIGHSDLMPCDFTMANGSHEGHVSHLTLRVTK